MDEELRTELASLFPRKTGEGIDLLYRKLNEKLGVEVLEDLLVLVVDDLKEAGLTTVEARVILKRYNLSGNIIFSQCVFVELSLKLRKT